MPSLFITGTDTGVGKTVVTAAIAAYLRQQSQDVGVMKPVESGSTPHSGDAAYLQKISGVRDPLRQINPYHFKAPLAPQLAAALEKKTISFACIARAHQRLAEAHRWVLVEGAGGVMVPLTSKAYVADLIAYLRLPVLVVARMSLGTLNHSLLTLDYLRRRRLKVAGVVFNCNAPDQDLSSRYNLKALQSRTKVPVWGVLGHVARPEDPGALSQGIAAGMAQAVDNFFGVV